MIWNRINRHQFRILILVFKKMEMKDLSFGVIFPGGGVQYTGMGKFYYDKFSFARETFDEASDILGYDLAKLCFHGDLKTLSSMRFSQPAVLTVEYISYLVLKNYFKIEPAMAAGHSLGEYAALVASGTLNFRDALYLISIRGKLLEAVGVKYNAGMLAVSGLPIDVIEEKCETFRSIGREVYCCVHNSAFQYIVCGSITDIELFASSINDLKVKTEVLNIGTASHSPFMKDITSEFAEALNTCTFNKPRFPVLSNIDVKPHEDDAAAIKQRLISHLTEPVKWQQTVETLAKNVDIIIESGPQMVLKKLCSYIIPGKPVYSIGIETDFNSLNTISSAWRPDPEGFIKQCKVIAVSEPNANKKKSGEGYISQVVDPMKKLLRFSQTGDYKFENVTESKELLQSILKGKGFTSLNVEAIISDLEKEYNLC